MSQEGNKYFSYKKTRVMYLLSIFVFTIHLSTLSNYDLNGDSVGKIILCMDKALGSITCIAVASFFMISAILFYRNYTYKSTKNKWKSRCKTLLVPYISWNCIWMIFNMICSYTFISKFFVGRDKAIFDIVNIFQGIFLYKYNGPFWFIFDLLLFTILCPVIYTIVKNKYVGGISIICLIVLSGFNIQIINSLFRTYDAFLCYIIGAYIGVHYFEYFKNKASKKEVIVYFFICLICFITRYYNIFMDNSMFEAINIVVYSLAFWKLLDLFNFNNTFRIEEDSFLVYAMHVNVGAIITKLIYIILPNNSFYAAINYILTIVLSLIFIHFFMTLIKNYFPQMRKILCGR